MSSFRTDPNPLPDPSFRRTVRQPSTDSESSTESDILPTPLTDNQPYHSTGGADARGTMPPHEAPVDVDPGIGANVGSSKRNKKGRASVVRKGREGTPVAMEDEVFSPTIASASASPIAGMPVSSVSGLGYELEDSASAGPPGSIGRGPMTRPGLSRARSGSRAAPPAPILVRDQSGSNTARLSVPVLGSANQSVSTDAPKGLNIPGLNLVQPTASIESDDNGPTGGSGAGAGTGDRDLLGAENDTLAELVPSPRRAFISQLNAYQGGAPASPAWGSMSPAFPGSVGLMPPPISGSPAAARASPQQTSNSGLLSPSPSIISGTSGVGGGHGRIPSISFSPDPRGNAGPSNRNSDTSSHRGHVPTPTHGIHSRNLSIFFPRPGQSPVVPEEGDLHGNDGEGAGQGELIPPGPGMERRTFAGAGQGGFSFGVTGEKSEGGERRGKRRGHHHKHSLSHNFFSFLDPTKTNPALSTEPHNTTSTTPSAPHSHSHPSATANNINLTSPKPPDAPQSVPMPLQPAALALHSPTHSGSLSGKADPMSQLLASFAVLEVLIGASLWVEGQMGGWRCLAGIGYMVVFDAAGVGVGVFARGKEGWRSVRRPYGMTRFLSLLYFSQCLFLVFAAVYIAKESIESVVLGSGGHEHGGGGGGHGHGHGHGHGSGDSHDTEERPFPTFLLLCATVASAVGGGVMHTHAKLVDAVGSLFLSTTYLSSPIVRRYPHLLANPFSLTVTLCSALILVGSLLVPDHSLQAYDSLLALLLTVLTTALSLPPAKAFGQVLLQTAPPASTAQMRAFTRILREVRDDRRVLGISQIRCWAVTAGSAPPPPPLSTTGSAVASPTETTTGDKYTHPHAHAHDTPPASPRSKGGMLRKQSSFQLLRPGSPSSPRSRGRAGTMAMADASNEGTTSASGVGSSASATGQPKPPAPLRRSSSAWFSPQGSPTVGEFGGIHHTQYPSISVLGQNSNSKADAPLVITVTLQVDEAMGDHEVLELTRDVWRKLSRVCGGKARRVGEVSVGIERLGG